ncbi:hypothetical protein ACFL0F_01520 [Patescibacteria group bacterium]
MGKKLDFTEVVNILVKDDVIILTFKRNDSISLDSLSMLIITKHLEALLNHPAVFLTEDKKVIRNPGPPDHFILRVTALFKGVIFMNLLGELLEDIEIR